MNLFEIASRKKLRFSTNKGDLTVEQLWDLPLKSSGLSLDKIAIELNKQLESTSISFVDEVKDTKQTNAKLLFDIVLHIINVRKAEIKESEEKLAKQSQLKFLKELQNKKRLESLESLSEEEIAKQIAELEK